MLSRNQSNLKSINHVIGMQATITQVKIAQAMFSNSHFYLFIFIYKESIAKIIRQNNKIISKLDMIISNQKSLEEKFEEKSNGSNNINNIDFDFIQVRFKIKI
jgi:hypothetical protein